MKRLFCALIAAISIHAVFLSIQINTVPKPGIETKTEPIKITMSHRQVKKQIINTPVTPNSTLKKQKPEVAKPLRKKPFKKHNIVQNKTRKVKTIKPPEPKPEPEHEPKPEPELEPEIDKKPLPKQNNVLANLPAVPKPDLPMEPELATVPVAVTSYEKKNTLLPDQYKPATAVISTKAIPKYKTNPKLEYPRLAKRRGYKGQTLLFVVVSEKGIAKEISISKSSGHKILDKAALKAVKKWQFYPGTKDGNPVEMNVTVPIRFDLK